NVIATSRSEDSVAAITDELRSNDVRTAEVTCDVRDRDSIEQLHDVAVDTFGGVDVLVNSAGAVDHAPLTEMDESTWDHAIDVFLTGVFRACQIFGRSMGTGSIINISSM